MLIASLRFNNYILELKISFIIKTSCNTDELSITETLKNDWRNYQYFQFKAAVA